MKLSIGTRVSKNYILHTSSDTMLFLQNLMVRLLAEPSSSYIIPWPGLNSYYPRLYFFINHHKKLFSTSCHQFLLIGKKLCYDMVGFCPYLTFFIPLFYPDANTDRLMFTRFLLKESRTICALSFRGLYRIGILHLFLGDVPSICFSDSDKLTLQNCRSSY